MDQRQLTSFITLAEELHFVQAAARLRITQSALSQQIAKLERLLGVRLLDRTKRRVALTDAGRIFLEEARKAAKQLETAAAMARRAAQGHIGRLTLAYVETAPFNILSPVVLAFRRAHPEVHLDLQEMITGEQVAALRTERLDVGLMRPMFDDASLSTVLLQKEPYVVALPKDHPLARADVLDLESLRHEPFIKTSPDKSRYIDGKFRSAFRRAGFTPRVVQEVNQIHATIGLVGGGLGVALVPLSVSKLALEGVVYRRLGDRDAPQAEMVAAWRSHGASPLVGRFVEIAKRAVGSMREREDPMEHPAADD